MMNRYYYDDDGNNDDYDDNNDHRIGPLHQQHEQQQQPPNNDTITLSTTTTKNSTETITVSNTSSTFMTPVILCILITETAERIVYFGFRAMLIFYFRDGLLFTETQSISYYAYTTAIAYYSPLVGSIVSDGYYGLYKTIYYFSLLYIIGLFILLIASWIDITVDEDNDSWWLLIKRFTSFVGLLMCCIGTGGIKPCVSAFGANQVDTSTTTTTSTTTESNNSISSYQQNSPINPPLSSILEKNRNSNNDNGEIYSNHDDSNNSLNETNVRLFFSYFYFCINLGAVTSIGIVPVVRVHYGFRIAFIIPFICMVIAVLLFTSKRYEYKHLPTNNNSNILQTLKLTVRIIYQQFKSNNNININERLRYNTRYCCQFYSRIPTTVIDISERTRTNYHRRDTYDDTDASSDSANMYIQRKTSKSSDDFQCIGDDTDDNLDEYNTGSKLSNVESNQDCYNDAAQIVHILPILLMLPIYWCLYDQQGSVWTLQASRMYLPYGITPEQLLLVNPIEIMIFLPLFGRLNVPQLTRMLWGMILTAVAFIVSGVVESYIEANQYDDPTTGVTTSNISAFWQLPQLTLLAIGEIFVSVTGLEFAYSTSPNHLKALVLGLFLATSAMGDSIGGLLYSTVFAHTNRATAMYTCSILMIINLLIFYKVAQWYTNTSYSDYVPPQNHGRPKRNSNNNNNIDDDNDHQLDDDQIELQHHPGVLT